MRMRATESFLHQLLVPIHWCAWPFRYVVRTLVQAKDRRRQRAREALLAAQLTYRDSPSATTLFEVGQSISEPEDNERAGSEEPSFRSPDALHLTGTVPLR